jgi:hypothetical protein
MLTIDRGAKLSTIGLYHYPAAIVDSSIATPFAAFSPGANGQAQSTAAVINTFAGGRQQMVFFLPFSTDWSMTSNILQHAWIAWATRGLCKYSLSRVEKPADFLRRWL